MVTGQFLFWYRKFYGYGGNLVKGSPHFDPHPLRAWKLRTMLRTTSWAWNLWIQGFPRKPNAIGTHNSEHPQRVCARASIRACFIGNTVRYLSGQADNLRKPNFWVGNSADSLLISTKRGQPWAVLVQAVGTDSTRNKRLKIVIELMSGCWRNGAALMVRCILDRGRGQVVENKPVLSTIAWILNVWCWVTGIGHVVAIGSRLNRRFILTGHAAITVVIGFGFFVLDVPEGWPSSMVLGNISIVGIVMASPTPANKSGLVTGW